MFISFIKGALFFHVVAQFLVQLSIKRKNQTPICSIRSLLHWLTGKKNENVETTINIFSYFTM